MQTTENGCFEDTHHRYYPAHEYRSPTEKRFRELDENKIRMCRQMHNFEHAAFEPPDKPDREIMLMAIQESRNRRLNGLA